MAEAGVNAAMLRWARERAGLSLHDLRARVRDQWSEKLAEWEAGRGGPTFEQARKLASVLRAPLGYLFLDEPPAAEIDVPDLRTVGNERQPMSVDLIDVVMDSQRKQAWLREYREEHGLPRLPWVGASSRTEAPQAIARRIMEALGLTARLREESKAWDGYLRVLIERAEDAGALVLRSGTVGNNTHRPLDVEEFRGFALVDAWAPVVFVNTRDVPPAQIFTLVHELVHLVIGVEGVSNAPVAKEASRQLRSEEELCNRVAAEVLLPGEEFAAAWSSQTRLAENAQGLARRFKVSQLVVARRALDDGLVTPQEYWPFVRRRMAEAQRQRDTQREGDGGPPFLTMVKVHNGRGFIATVVRAVRAGELSYREGARLLGTKPKHIDELGA